MVDMHEQMTNGNCFLIKDEGQGSTVKDKAKIDDGKPLGSASSSRWS